MSKILVYKRADGIIAECCPVAKEVLQKELATIGVDDLRARHQAAFAYESSRGELAAASVHTKRLAWLNTINDLNNLSDQEYQDFIHCHTPDDHIYHHWVDAAHMPQDRSYRDAWVDIDAHGNVTHDIEKARQIQLARNHAAKQTADAQAAKNAIIKEDPVASMALNSIDDLKGVASE